MGFFDSFKEKATDLMQAGAAQSKRLAEIAKLKTANMAEEDTIKKAYVELGKLYYAEKGATPEAAYAASCEKITAARAAIETNNERIAELKAKDPEDEDGDGIIFEEIKSSGYTGYLITVLDPKRVFLGMPDTYGGAGLTLENMVKKYDALGGINAGGFVDTGGAGTGGLPIGLVIKDGELLYGDLNSSSSIVGFDQNDVLVVGTLTGQECLDRGIRDAVSFGPAFIVDGQAMEVTGSGGGLNPRTVLGQRADGAVLMLVIDGRQPHSLGATYKDCIDVMLEYGAVNAGNLDGGSSTILLYDGEVRNVCASLYGPRNLPTAFIVK